MKPKKKAKPNLVHELFAMHLKELGLKFKREVEVLHGRRFRWDFVFWAPDYAAGNFSSWAVEIDGYFKGRHRAFGGDNEKMNLATVNGWRFLRFSTQQVNRGKAKQFIAEKILGKVQP
jgi:very-short-patch-repair endonuclease